MSTESRELGLEARERWPVLYQFLGAYCHQDWPEEHGTPEDAVNAAIADYPLEMRQQVVREWREWNAAAGAVDDVRKMVNEGLGVEVWFEKPSDGRDFMNEVGVKLIASIRTDLGGQWRP